MLNNGKHLQNFLENSYYQISMSKLHSSYKIIVIITYITNQHAYRTQAKQIYRHY